MFFCKTKRQCYVKACLNLSFTKYGYIWVISGESNRHNEKDYEVKGQPEENEMKKTKTEGSKADRKNAFQDGNSEQFNWIWKLFRCSQRICFKGLNTKCFAKTLLAKRFIANFLGLHYEG